MEGLLFWKQVKFLFVSKFQHNFLQRTVNPYLGHNSWLRVKYFSGLSKSIIVSLSLISAVVYLNEAVAARSYIAFYNVPSYSGSGSTAELACIDLVNNTNAGENGNAVYESVIIAPAGISKECGDSFVTGAACRIGNGAAPNSPDYCTDYAYVREIGSSAEYTIRLYPATLLPESSSILTSVEPDNAAGLIAKVYDENETLVQNIDVELEVEVVANSGGHQHHNSNRPKGSLGGAAPTPHIVTGNTQTDGFRFSFAAPVVAGDYKITATCVAYDCTQEGPDVVWVGIKSLVSLGSGPHHVLIGETSSHFDNHYLTQNARNRFLQLAYLYKMIWFPLNPLIHANDASLERGGLFDVYATWRGPHFEHRRGTVIDIRANNRAGAIPEQDFESFEQLAKESGMEAMLERKIDEKDNELVGHRHYHLRIDGKKE